MNFENRHVIILKKKEEGNLKNMLKAFSKETKKEHSKIAIERTFQNQSVKHILK